MAATDTKVATPLMAFKHSVKPKRLSKAAQEAKHQRDLQRARTRINLMQLFPRWREVRDRLGLALDRELAELLLDSFEKLTAGSPIEIPKPSTSRRRYRRQQNHIQKPLPGTPLPLYGPLPTECPSCGFVLSQWYPQNRDTPNEEHQPESIEVTLELEQKDDPVSGAEEADGDSDVSDEEDESEGSEVNEGNGGGENSEEEWSSDLQDTPTLIKTEPTETSEEEEKGEGEGSGVNEGNGGAEQPDKDWTPGNEVRIKSEPTETIVEEEEEEEEDDEEEEEEGSGLKDSDEDWTPGLHDTEARIKREPKEKAVVEKEESAETEHRPGKRKLCIECGSFYKKLPHECEHKIRPFVCNICGRRCVSETALKIHYVIHSETYEHPCKYCLANFKTKMEKLAHELVHQEQDDVFKCPECPQTFETFKERTMHLKQHRDENPFKCAVCGIMFREKPQFLRHLAVHTGEKPFKCPMCERSFKQASHLKSHLRLHTGERPYSCKLCDKSFNHNVSLKSHMQRYHLTGEDTLEMEPEREKESPEVNKRAIPKQKNRKPPTGRPKGRPKRNVTATMASSKTTDESDNESEKDLTVSFNQ